MRDACLVTHTLSVCICVCAIIYHILYAYAYNKTQQNSAIEIDNNSRPFLWVVWVVNGDLDLLFCRYIYTNLMIWYPFTTTIIITGITLKIKRIRKYPLVKIGFRGKAKMWQSYRLLASKLLWAELLRPPPTVTVTSWSVIIVIDHRKFPLLYCTVDQI